MSDIWIIIISVTLSLAGIAGCFLPVLPGPLLNYCAVLLLQFTHKSFSLTFLILWGIVVAVMMVMDYLLPILVAKKFGATKYGVWGSVIGLVAGIFFTPVGMILGMLIGAVVGELIGGSDTSTAVKAGLATFAGTIFSNVIMCIVSVVLTVFVVIELVRIW